MYLHLLDVLWAALWDPSTHMAMLGAESGYTLSNQIHIKIKASVWDLRLSAGVLGGWYTRRSLLP